MTTYQKLVLKSLSIIIRGIVEVLRNQRTGEYYSYRTVAMEIDRELAIEERKRRDNEGESSKKEASQ